MRCRRAASAFSARCSWKKSSSPFTSSMIRMMVKSSHFCTRAESTAAISIIQGIGPQKRRKMRCQRGSSRSSISLGPNSRSRRSTSSPARPRCGSVFSSSSVVWTSCRAQSSVVLSGRRGMCRLGWRMTAQQHDGGGSPPLQGSTRKNARNLIQVRFRAWMRVNRRQCIMPRGGRRLGTSRSRARWAWIWRGSSRLRSLAS